MALSPYGTYVVSSKRSASATQATTLTAAAAIQIFLSIYTFILISSASKTAEAARTSARATRSCLTFDAHLGQAVTQSVSGKSQNARRLALVAVGLFERVLDELLLIGVEAHPFGQ